VLEIQDSRHQLPSPEQMTYNGINCMRLARRCSIAGQKNRSIGKRQTSIHDLNVDIDGHGSHEKKRGYEKVDVILANHSDCGRSTVYLIFSSEQ
jgi:hypothetical protein